MLLIKSKIIEYNIGATLYLILLGLIGTSLGYLVSIKKQLTLIPTAYQPPVKNLKAIILGLIVLPCLLLTGTTTAMLYFQHTLETKGSLSISTEYQNKIKKAIQGLEEGKFSEEKKTKLIKALAEEVIQSDEHLKTYHKLFDSFLIHIVYILIVLTTGIIFLYKKERDIKSEGTFKFKG